MNTLFIPTESDFRRWIDQVIKKHIEKIPPQRTNPSPNEEPLLTRNEIAGIFRISLVTLHDWMKRGLPCHKQRGRVYFLRSEAVAYIRQKGGSKATGYILREQECTSPFGYKLLNKASQEEPKT